MNNLVEYLNEKFQSYKPGRWSLPSFDYAGADFGFELFQYGTGDWQLKTMEDSGYGPSRLILQTQDEKIIWALAECFAPTNPNYKTQRK